MQSITVKKRFCGPSNSGNGGYVCGVLAGAVGTSAAEVTLWKPPPLDVALSIEKGDDKVVRLWHDLPDDRMLLSEARSAELTLDVPSAPSYYEAEEAAKHYAGFDEHPFPDCFVCGTARKPGDGLCIFAGPIKESAVVAAPWIPDISLADQKGFVKTEFIWAALDCPGAFAAFAWIGKARPALLGRFTARVDGSIKAGEPCIVIGWPIDRDGRKYFTGTALFTQSGSLLAMAKAIWIEPKA